MTFREYLNESPYNIGNADETNAALEFSKQVKDYIKDVTPKNKLFSNYMYGEKENTIVIFHQNIPVFYILYKKEGRDMKIKNIENISNIKGLSFKIYNAILLHGLFDKIYTGDSLSAKNIEAHKKYITNNFNIYISDTNEPVTLQNFDNIIKKLDIKTEFYITNNKYNEMLLHKYNLEIIKSDNSTIIDKIIED